MTLKNILIALTWLFLFLLQVSFMAGTGDLWSAINLLVIVVIGLGYWDRIGPWPPPLKRGFCWTYNRAFGGSISFLSFYSLTLFTFSRKK